MIQKQSDDYVKAYGLVPTSKCMLTDPGALPCRAVIHAVGPIYEGNEPAAPAELMATMQCILETCEEKGFASVSVPAISSGLFKFPKDLCAHILIDVSMKFLATSKVVQCVRMVNFDEETVGYFEKEARVRAS